MPLFSPTSPPTIVNARLSSCVTKIRHSSAKTLVILPAFFPAITAPRTFQMCIRDSRWSDPVASKLLEDNCIELVRSNLLEAGAVDALPEAPNVIYMAGKKFGTNGQEAQTWAMNAWLPSRVAEKYKHSRITVFSTGNVYPQVPLSCGGATEEIHPLPVGEYAMSSLARERMFEYAAQTYGTKIAVFRLNYSVDLRYGVLFDICSSILNGDPVSLAAVSYTHLPILSEKRGWDFWPQENHRTEFLLCRVPVSYTHLDVYKRQT